MPTERFANLADLGLQRQRQQATIGFIAPTLIYSQMRDIDANARALLADFQSKLLSTDGSRLAFEGWFNNSWTPFFSKSVGTIGAKIANAFETEQLQAQTNQYRNELADFHKKFDSLNVGPSSAPLPEAPVPNPPPPPGESPGFLSNVFPKLTVPWWAWVIGGAALVGGGYFFYKTMKEYQATQKELAKTVLPMLFPEGAIASRVAAAHDVVGSCVSCGK